MIRTVTLTNGDRWYSYVYADDQLVLAGPLRATAAEAESEALRFYAEGAHLPRRMRAEERVSYGCIDDERREARTVSSRINGRSAAGYWGGR